MGLLPVRMFEGLVNNRKLTSEKLAAGLNNLFTVIRDGGLYGNDDIPWFNGGLFKKISEPVLTVLDTTELRNAAALNWSAIDVSIFGTLFECVLDPAKRSQLGAHYTDPATIMRIVEPVMQRALLQIWEQSAQEIRGLMAKSTRKGEKNHKAAQAKFIEGLDQLREYRVLDPACGSGNFLFLGGSKKRRELGDDYFDALNTAYANRVPGFGDLVCYWFDKALKGIETNSLSAAGLVFTNSIRGGANRKLLDAIAERSHIFEA